MIVSQNDSLPWVNDEASQSTVMIEGFYEALFVLAVLAALFFILYRAWHMVWKMFMLESNLIRELAGCADTEPKRPQSPPLTHRRHKSMPGRRHVPRTKHKATASTGSALVNGDGLVHPHSDRVASGRRTSSDEGPLRRGSVASTASHASVDSSVSTAHVATTQRRRRNVGVDRRSLNSLPDSNGLTIDENYLR